MDFRESYKTEFKTEMLAIPNSIGVGFASKMAERKMVELYRGGWTIISVCSNSNLTNFMFFCKKVVLDNGTGPNKLRVVK